MELRNQIENLKGRIKLLSDDFGLLEIKLKEKDKVFDVGDENYIKMFHELSYFPTVCVVRVLTPRIGIGDSAIIHNIEKISEAIKEIKKYCSENGYECYFNDEFVKNQG